MSSVRRRDLFAALPMMLTSAAQPAKPSKPTNPSKPPTMIARPIDPTDGNYSEGMEITGFTRLVFISGQVPVDADDRVPETFREQARVSWRNVAAQLAKAGMTVKNIVKMTIFLSDRQYRGEAYETRHEVLGDHCPAMTIIICGIYRESWLLEIEAIAAD